MVGSVHDVFQGASILAWMYQHTLGHHPYTNIDGADPDIVTASSVSGFETGLIFAQHSSCIVSMPTKHAQKYQGFIQDLAWGEKLTCA